MILTADGRDSRTLRWDEPAPLELTERHSPLGSARCWSRQLGRHGYLSVLASVDGGSLHISIAHNTRYPTWDEILAVRKWGFPAETEVVMVLARESEYVNTHPNCFHLWESWCGREGR